MLKNAIHVNNYKDRDINGDFHEEYQYLNLLNDILNEGFVEEGRNGFTKSVYGCAMRFSLENGKIPILTTKKLAHKTCLKELLWFIKGQTDNKILTDQNVHIWDGNNTIEFKKTRGLEHLGDNDLGGIYGFNWRFFGAEYKDCYSDYKNQGVDQLQNVIDTLKDKSKRTSRRMIVTALNPSTVDKAVLPPCHVLFQFNVVDNNKLSCSVYCRSQDCPLGQPFNIASYAFLTHLIAKHTNLEPYELMLYGGNCHIYEEHIETIKSQIDRKPYEFPTLEITTIKQDINDYTINDFKLCNYKYHEAIKMDMVA